jgi:hypothetical protein
MRALTEHGTLTQLTSCWAIVSCIFSSSSLNEQNLSFRLSLNCSGRHLHGTYHRISEFVRAWLTVLILALSHRAVHLASSVTTTHSRLWCFTPDRSLLDTLSSTDQIDPSAFALCEISVGYYMTRSPSWLLITTWETGTSGIAQDSVDIWASYQQSHNKYIYILL